MRPFALAVVTVVLAGCMTYDFMPVTPVTFVLFGEPIPLAGTAPLPRMMLVVDKSGSMDFDINADAKCSTPGCRTRWQDLTTAMDAFLATSRRSAHLGMVPYPVTTACGAAGLGDITAQGVQLNVSRDDDLVSLDATADAINTSLAGIFPNGGTPTGASLRMLTGYAPLVTKGASSRYVLLLTDGLPNCNDDYATSTLDCFCTTSNALQPANTCSTIAGNACLDQDGTIAAIEELKALGVKTIVVGFGPTTANSANRLTLSAMARAGGFERQCTNDADCGAGDTCSVDTFSPCGVAIKACSKPDFQASNAADLGRVLDLVRSTIVCNDPCKLTLESRPENAEWISVRVSGKVLPSGPDTWRYLPAPNQLEFLGSTCDAIRAASLADPRMVEVRAGSRF